MYFQTRVLPIEEYGRSAAFVGITGLSKSNQAQVLLHNLGILRHLLTFW